MSFHYPATACYGLVPHPSLSLIHIFGRVVGVIAEEYNPVVLQLEVEAAVHSAEACHALLAFFVGGTAEMGECHGGNTILDVDADGNTQLDVYKRQAL